MAEKVEEKVTLTIGDGIRFGLGFFMVGLSGLAATMVAAWLIIIAARYFGLAF